MPFLPRFQNEQETGCGDPGRIIDYAHHHDWVATANNIVTFALAWEIMSLFSSFSEIITLGGFGIGMVGAASGTESKAIFGLPPFIGLFLESKVERSLINCTKSRLGRGLYNNLHFVLQSIAINVFW